MGARVCVYYILLVKHQNRFPHSQPHMVYRFYVAKSVRLREKNREIPGFRCFVEYWCRYRLKNIEIAFSFEQLGRFCSKIHIILSNIRIFYTIVPPKTRTTHTFQEYNILKTMTFELKTVNL